MQPDLLASATEQAEQSSPPVRAAALMRIARVETASNQTRARQTFAQALAEIRRLPGLDGQLLLHQARRLAAAVAPDLLREIPSSGNIPKHIEAQQLGQIMLQHEHGDAAFEFLTSYDEPSTFPYPVAMQLMEWYGDEERRLAVLRCAINAWRAAPNDMFIHWFQLQWKRLPPDEALSFARDIVRVTLEQPDRPISANYDKEGAAQFTSGREDRLFHILGVLRQIDAPLAESLIASHEQLAAAARRYPNGMDSVLEEIRSRASASGASCGGGYGIGGAQRDFPYLEALMQSQRDGEFGPPIDHALERYLEDISPEHPNEAPREFWPSTCSFRSILYAAGNRLGPAAAAYLDRIPDPDLRLFAQIELAAALAGLPEIQGAQRRAANPGRSRLSAGSFQPK